MSLESVSGFFVLPVGIDGESVGSGFWERSRLSERWLGVCKDYLAAHGAAFEASWDGDIQHVRAKVTSASGAALVTLFVHGKVVLSILLLSGISPQTDNAVSQMFVDSLKRTAPVRVTAQSLSPFTEIFAKQGRPLMVLVPWPQPTVTDEDHGLAYELALHLAGAFFRL